MRITDVIFIGMLSLMTISLIANSNKVLVQELQEIRQVCKSVGSGSKK